MVPWTCEYPEEWRCGQSCSAAASDDVIFNSVPFLDTKFYSNYIYNAFQNYWAVIKLWRIKPNISLWPYLQSTKREIWFLNRLRIWHTNLTHKFLFQNLHLVQMCLHCQHTLTVQHILIDCVHFANMSIRWKFPAILGNLLGEDVHLNNLVQFLHDVDSYNDIWF